MFQSVPCTAGQLVSGVTIGGGNGVRLLPCMFQKAKFHKYNIACSVAFVFNQRAPKLKKSAGGFLLFHSVHVPK